MRMQEKKTIQAPQLAANTHIQRKCNSERGAPDAIRFHKILVHRVTRGDQQSWHATVIRRFSAMNYIHSLRIQAELDFVEGNLHHAPATGCRVTLKQVRSPKPQILEHYTHAYRVTQKTPQHIRGKCGFACSNSRIQADVRVIRMHTFVHALEFEHADAQTTKQNQRIRIYVPMPGEPITHACIGFLPNCGRSSFNTFS